MTRLDPQVQRHYEWLGPLDRSRKFIAFDEDHFRTALSSGLEILGAGPLEPVAGEPGEYTFPALDRRAGADPSWARALDALRSPRPREEDPGAWRREAPLRPVVFRDPGTLDAKTVHLHLEHRVVRRVLGRFLSQGFVHFDLSRACVGVSSDPVPRVVLLGRLSLYGEGASRLHDEVIPVAARWTPPDARRRPLAPFAEAGETTTLALLEQALATPREVPAAVTDAMLAAIPGDVEALLPHLVSRAEAVEATALGLLADRGDREAQAMVGILEAQRGRIRKEQEKWPEDRQVYMAFEGLKEAERRQLLADRRHWQARLAGIEKEMVSEPDRIRRAYQVHARRVEPVGIVYLWPVSG